MTTRHARQWRPGEVSDINEYGRAHVGLLSNFIEDLHRQGFHNQELDPLVTFTDGDSCGIMVSMNDAPTPSTPSRILVVDDQRNMRTTTVLLLRCEGYDVIGAASGEEALAMLAHHEVDLMLTGLKMEPMDGFTLIQRALEQTPTLVVIILTAFSSMENAVECMRLGAYDYIQKPLKDGEFQLRVKHALERGRQSSQLRRPAGGALPGGPLNGS